MLGAVSCLSIYNMIGVDYSKHVRVYVDLHAMTAVPSKCAGLYKKIHHVSCVLVCYYEKK
jgi:hypothetical protein